jgi:sulfoxide reductase heme-binding subunit YedZ
MSPTDPLDHAWWLASRASGIVALAAMSFSVVLGLMLGGKLVKHAPSDRQGRKLTTPLIVNRAHEQASLVALVAIAVHALTLMGDAYLHPTLTQLAVPFTIEYRPLATGMGIIGGYIAAILGLSYYLRKRIGNDRWRRLHRYTLVAFVLSVGHTLTAGTDAASDWLFWPVVAVTGLVALLLVARIASTTARTSQRTASIKVPNGSPPTSASRNSPQTILESSKA